MSRISMSISHVLATVAVSIGTLASPVAQADSLECGKLRKLEVPSYRVKVSRQGSPQGNGQPVSVKIGVYADRWTVDSDDMKRYSSSMPIVRLEAKYDSVTDEYVTPAIEAKFKNAMNFPFCRDTFQKVVLQVNAPSRYWVSPESARQVAQIAEYEEKEVSIIRGDSRGRVTEMANPSAVISVDLKSVK